MKNYIIALTLLFISPACLASSYELAVRKQELCDTIGGWGANAYAMKLKRKTKPDLWVLKPNAGSAEYKVAEMHDFAINYAYNEASSLTDARMRSWARCMDMSE